MRIGIDIDGVVLDFSKRWAEAHLDWFGVPSARKDANRIFERMARDPELMRWFERAGYWDEMDWVPGAKAGLDTLSERHALAFITRRPAAGQRSLVGLPWITGNLYPVAPGISKATVHCNLYIDDHVGDISQLRRAHLPAIQYGIEPWETWRAVVAAVELFESDEGSLVNLEDPAAVRAREREVAAWRKLADLEP